MCVPGFLDTAGPSSTSPLTAKKVLPSTKQKASASRTITFSVLISPAYPHLDRRSAGTLAGTNARLEEMRGWLVLHIGRLSLPELAPVSLAHPLTVYELPPQTGIARLLCIAAVCLAQEQGYKRSRGPAFRHAVWAARIRFEYVMASSTTARRKTSVYGTPSRRARPKAASRDLRET